MSVRDSDTAPRSRRGGPLALASIVALAALAVAARAGDEPAAGKAFPKVEVLFNTSEVHKPVAEAIVQMWKKELGITVGLGNTEWKVYLDRMTKLDYDIVRAGWVWDYNDPHNMFECWTTGNGNNRTGWSSPKYDALLDAAKHEGDNKKRWELYRQAETLLLDECPILPIYFYVNKNMLDPKVKGWHDNNLNLHPYDAMWIEEGGSPAPPEKQRLVFNNASEPATLDPAVMTGVPEHRIAIALFEGLARLDPTDLHPIPGAAASWDVADGGKTYTFHLREDARWSNGDPVTAEDFRWSWLRAIDPKALSEPAEYAQIFDWIEGARELREQKGPASKVGIIAKDARTLVVKLTDPCPFWLNLCAFETLMPVHRATVEKHGVKWTQPENIVANGPFVLKTWVMNSRLVFTPAPRYWGKDRVKLREVVFLPIESQDTALNMFLAGEADWLDDVPLARADQVKAHAHFRRSPFLAVYYYRFKCTKPPFDDVRVRKAFTMALDRRTICKRVMKFGETPAEGVIPRSCGTPPYESVRGIGYDPEGARKLLREAGYEIKAGG